MAHSYFKQTLYGTLLWRHKPNNIVFNTVLSRQDPESLRAYTLTLESQRDHYYIGITTNLQAGLEGTILHHQNMALLSTALPVKPHNSEEAITGFSCARCLVPLGSDRIKYSLSRATVPGVPSRDGRRSARRRAVRSRNVLIAVPFMAGIVKR